MPLVKFIKNISELSTQNIKKPQIAYISATDLLLWLTKRCNMRCPGCLWLLNDQNSFSNYDMSYDEAKKIIKYYHDRDIKKIHLQANGEILLHKHYTDLITYCFQLGLSKPKVITNGLLLNNYIDFVIKNLSAITISIDGYNSKTYNLRRGGDEKVFNKIIDNVGKLVEARNSANVSLYININCIVSKSQYDYISGMISLAERLGVDHLRFGNYHPTGEGEEDFSPIYYNDADIVEYLNKITERNDYKVSIALPSLYGRATQFNCSMLFNTVLIDPRGFFSPCCHVQAEEKYGSFYDNPEDFNSETILAFRETFLQAKTYADLPSNCRECPRLSPKIASFDAKNGKWFNKGLLSSEGD